MTMVRKRILLVDDEHDFVNVFSMRLHSRDYIVSVACTGKEALEKAKEIPDLILLDLGLPDMSGYEVCRQLREDKLTSRIPIIILTSRDAPQDKVKGLYTGADDYITKPFEIEEVFARMEAVLRRNRPFQERVKDKAQAIKEVKGVIEGERITPYFQPIFYLKPRHLLGREVLSRPPAQGYFGNPEVLFDAAFHLGMLFDLEKMCHEKALLKLDEKAKESLTFFNVSPYLIQDAKFKEFSAFYENYTQAENVVLELTERTAIDNFSGFLKTIEFFKEEGFKISIDDIGSGYAALDLIVEIKPDFIKIDRHLIQNIHNNPVKQNLLKAIIGFCGQSEITSIAEGIEKEEELKVLVDYGVDAGQGYLLAKPSLETKLV